MKPVRILIASLFSTMAAFAAPKPIDPADFKEPVKVACIGDSITQGSGIPDPGKNAYPGQLQSLLGDQWKVGNFGVSGRTLLKKGDFPYWKEKAYQDALAFAPDVVIIKLGTNDTKPQNWKHEAEFTADYTELVKSFLSLPSKPRVYVCRPAPVIGGGAWGINEKNSQEWIKRIDQIAKDLDLGVIDMHAALAGKPQLIPDKVHPNLEGAGVMAATAFEALTGKKAPEAVAK